MTESRAAPPSASPGTLARVHRMLRSNWISSTGAALMTLALMAGITISALHSAGGEWGGPYMGIVLTVLLPAMFALGLVMVPLGLFLYRRRLRARVETMTDRPMYLARAVVILTAVNFAAVGTAGYAGARYMSSVTFCGTACHSAMQPEYVTYLDSPHNRVDCVACHVTPGARGFIEAKLGGTRQLINYLADDYQRPIPTPVHNLTPARHSCESCHWPEKYLGTKLLVKPHYREDEQVSGYTNVLLMRTGGTRIDGASVGIHWHVHPEAVVEYVATDAQRNSIPWVRVLKPDGTADTFALPGFDHERPPTGEMRRMDCNDCHNRSAHDFQMPGEAVDRLIAAGLIPRELPFVKKHAVEALRGDWTREGAADGIRRHMQQAYAQEGRLDERVRQQLEGTVDQLVRVWRRNIYPERKVFWGAYPSRKNHEGCFRCHDGNHRTAAGRAIGNDCAMCHVVLSENQENPAILQTFGMGGR